MGARGAVLFAASFLCVAFAELISGFLASEVSSSSEDVLGDGGEVGATESALPAPGEEGQGQAASEAASVDQPLSFTRRGRGNTYRPSSKPTEEAFAAEDPDDNSRVVEGGFFYQEDEEEEEGEEDIYNTEELEVVRMIHLSREAEEEKPAVWGGIGDAVNLHAPTQFVMWVLLAAVVYLIMRGATRGEEKQKSLELHRKVLKTTIERLIRGKNEKQRLRKQRDGMMRDRTVLLRETIGTQAELASVLSDIQQTGTLEGARGVVGDQLATEETQKESGVTSSAGTDYHVTGITVPGFESGPVDLNKELHEHLYNLGDTAFQEVAVIQLANELRRKIWLRNTYGGGNWDGLKQLGSLPREEAEEWFVAAADSLNPSAGESGQRHFQNVQEADAVQEGGSPQARTKRERKMDLLGLAAAMMRRKMSLEAQLEDMLEQINHFPAAEEAALREIRSASKNLKQVVFNWHENLKKEFERVSSLLDRESSISEDTREAVRHAYTIAMSTDALLGKLISFEAKDCEVSAEDTEKASVTRFKLLQMMQHANKLLAENLKQFVESGDAGAHRLREHADQLGDSLSMIDYSYRDTAGFLANLHSQLLVYDLQRKKGIIQAAPLKKKAQTLCAQLEETDCWLQEAMLSREPPCTMDCELTMNRTLGSLPKKLGGRLDEAIRAQGRCVTLRRTYSGHNVDFESK
ncbi:hypothetical protein Emag_001745 [Eimeria magna]